MNFIPAQLVEGNAEAPSCGCASGELISCAVDASSAEPVEEVTLGVRPEHLSLAAATNRITVTVTFVESLGSSTQAYCVLPGVEEALTCTLGGQSKVRDGQSLALSIAASDCYLFDAVRQGVLAAPAGGRRGRRRLAEAAAVQRKHSPARAVAGRGIAGLLAAWSQSRKRAAS